MRPSNMPARVERRRLRALMPAGQKVEPGLDTLVSQRSISTKKKRTARK